MICASWQVGQKAYIYHLLSWKCKLKWGIISHKSELDNPNFDQRNFNTILVEISVGRTILGNVFSVFSKDTPPLDPVIPLIGANS